MTADLIRQAATYLLAVEDGQSEPAPVELDATGVRGLAELLHAIAREADGPLVDDDTVKAADALALAILRGSLL